MSAIAHKFIVDEKGQAQEVILSIETFRHIQEVLGADLDTQEEAELQRAFQDSISGNRDAFVSIDES
ncbi:hypothetical protein BH11VER1_BH11VER1_33430 [soil metagenome]